MNDTLSLGRVVLRFSSTFFLSRQDINTKFCDEELHAIRIINIIGKGSHCCNCETEAVVASFFWQLLLRKPNTHVVVLSSHLRLL